MKGISWANFVLGVWLFFSPFGLPFSLIPRDTHMVYYQHFILGFLIAAFAIWRVLGTSEGHHMAPVSWILAVLGVLTFISPFALKISSVTAVGLMWNDVLVGVIVTALGVFNAVQEPIALPTHHPQH